MTRKIDVTIIGAGGRQAQAMLAAAARGGDVSAWLAVDRAWNPIARAATEKLGVSVVEQDPIANPEALDRLMRSTRVVANQGQCDSTERAGALGASLVGSR